MGRTFQYQQSAKPVTTATVDPTVYGWMQHNGTPPLRVKSFRAHYQESCCWVSQSILPAPFSPQQQPRHSEGNPIRLKRLAIETVPVYTAPQTALLPLVQHGSLYPNAEPLPMRVKKFHATYGESFSNPPQASLPQPAFAELFPNAEPLPVKIRTWRADSQEANVQPSPQTLPVSVQTYPNADPLPVRSRQWQSSLDYSVMPSLVAVLPPVPYSAGPDVYLPSQKIRTIHDYGSPFLLRRLISLDWLLGSPDPETRSKKLPPTQFSYVAPYDYAPQLPFLPTDIPQRVRQFVLPLSGPQAIQTFNERGFPGAWIYVDAAMLRGRGRSYSQSVWLPMQSGGAVGPVIPPPSVNAPCDIDLIGIDNTRTSLTGYGFSGSITSGGMTTTIASIITRGYGTFSNVNRVVTRGYGIASTAGGTVVGSMVIDLTGVDNTRTSLTGEC